MTSPEENKPPPISPFLFPILLALFGIWCFYDGWLNTDPDMEYALFNQVASAILIPWAIIDFIRTRKLEKQYRESEDNKKPQASSSDKNDADS